MTKEFAIALLKQDIQNSKQNISYRHNEVGIEALQLAIKALEQQTCEDCISRQRVLNDLENVTKGSEHPRQAFVFVDECVDYITSVPSITPSYNSVNTELEQTNWIPCSERLPDTNDKVLCWYEYYHWSQEKVLPEYGIGCYLRETSAWFGEVANGKDVRVIAWMPLPEPYKAESEDEE